MEGGEPTVRGRRGMLALERALHAVADSEGLATYSVVHSENERHLAALRERGYVDVPVTVLKREPR